MVKRHLMVTAHDDVRVSQSSYMNVMSQFNFDILKIKFCNIKKESRDFVISQNHICRVHESCWKMCLTECGKMITLCMKFRDIFTRFYNFT